MDGARNGRILSIRHAQCKGPAIIFVKKKGTCYRFIHPSIDICIQQLAVHQSPSLRASPAVRRIFLFVCVGYAHKKTSTCLHTSVLSPAVPFLQRQEHIYLTACVIREKRGGEILFVWLGMTAWLKEEREGCMQPNRTRTDARTRPHRRIPAAYLVHICVRTDTADVLRRAAVARFLSVQTQTDVAPLEMPWAHSIDLHSTFFLRNTQNICLSL
jgi:hypothetical protein